MSTIFLPSTTEEVFFPKFSSLLSFVKPKKVTAPNQVVELEELLNELDAYLDKVDLSKIEVSEDNLKIVEVFTIVSEVLKCNYNTSLFKQYPAINERIEDMIIDVIEFRNDLRDWKVPSQDLKEIKNWQRNYRPQ
ncbi:MAG: hypothetical protein ABIV51_05055 [Saprospiraceae bacterium]